MASGHHFQAGPSSCDNSHFTLPWSLTQSQSQLSGKKGLLLGVGLSPQWVPSLPGSQHPASNVSLSPLLPLPLLGAWPMCQKAEDSVS